MSLWQVGAFLAQCPGGQWILGEVTRSTWRDTHQWCQDKVKEWREQVQVTGQRLWQNAQTVTAVMASRTSSQCRQWWQIWNGGGGSQPMRLAYQTVRQQYMRL